MKPSVKMPVVIEPVQHITPKLWTEMGDLFGASYSTKSKHSGFRRLSYEISEFYRVAVARQGRNMVGFVMLIDMVHMQRTMLARPGVEVRGFDHPIWDINRSATLNSRQIETVWVRYANRGQGIATKLYRYALDHMGATSIHIDSERVYNSIDYWRDLGFTHQILNRTMCDDNELPSLKLHIATDSTAYHPLDQLSMLHMYHERGLQLV